MRKNIQPTEVSELFSKYPYIVAWGHMMGSYDYYIEAQCREASAAKAPSTVIYFSDTAKAWVEASEEVKARLAPYLLY